MKKLESKRLFFFQEFNLTERVESVRGTRKLDVLDLKYAYLIHKAISCYTNKREMYKQKGVSYRIKSNNTDDKQDRLNTLSYLFGGSTTVIKQMIEHLIEWKVLKLFKEYRIGERARSYKLTPEFEQMTVSMKTYYGNESSVIGKLNRLWTERLKHPLVAATQHIYDKHVSVSDDCLSFVQEKYQHPNIDLICDAIRGGYFDDNKEALIEQIREVKIQPEDMVLFSFILKDTYCSPVRNSKRLFHPLTNLTRAYRKYILIDGKPMLELDITASQPTFSVALIREKLAQLTKHVPEDMKRYEQACKDGNFYELIAEHAGMNIVDEVSRKHFKKQFFKEIFFSKNRDKDKRIHPIRQAFRTLFPTAAKMIWRLKDGNHRNFAVKLQNLEADLMIYTVYRQLLDEGYILLPLHDALYCSSYEARERAMELIRDAFSVKYKQQITFKGELHMELQAA